ncbi:hypothetical protein KIN20_009740, partial [Parelaphostrongylus tenuis]
IFAVLAPIGPLRKVQEKAGDYSQDVLRFLMFTADAKSMPNAGEEEESSEEGSLESETEAEALQQHQNEAVTTSSFSLTEESEVGIVPRVEQPLLRRRIRQTAGTEPLVLVDDIPEKKHRVENKDEVAVEMEMNENDDDSNSSSDENSFDDTEALRLKNVVKSSSCSSSTSSSSLSSSSSANYSSSDSSDLTTTEEEDGNVQRTPITAADALNDDNSLRLGMGDFVFYSVLVGQAATTGSIGATIAAAFGVVYGLLITLTYFSNGDETTPALPISIVLGTAFHFTYLSLEASVMYNTDIVFHYLLHAIID